MLRLRFQSRPQRNKIASYSKYSARGASGLSSYYFFKSPLAVALGGGGVTAKCCADWGAQSGEERWRACWRPLSASVCCRWVRLSWYINLQNPRSKTKSWISCHCKPGVVRPSGDHLLRLARRLNQRFHGVQSCSGPFTSMWARFSSPPCTGGREHLERDQRCIGFATTVYDENKIGLPK